MTLIQLTLRSKTINRPIASGGHTHQHQADFLKAVATATSSPNRQGQPRSADTSTAPTESTDAAAPEPANPVAVNAAHTIATTERAVLKAAPAADLALPKRPAGRDAVEGVLSDRASLSKPFDGGAPLPLLPSSPLLLASQSASEAVDASPAGSELGRSGSLVDLAGTDPRASDPRLSSRRLPASHRVGAAIEPASQRANVALHLPTSGGHRSILAPVAQVDPAGSKVVAASIWVETPASHGGLAAARCDAMKAPTIDRAMQQSAPLSVPDPRYLAGAQIEARGGHAMIIQPSGTVSVRMSLAHLGMVEVRVGREPHSVSVTTILADRPETLRTLIADQEQLKAALHQSCADQGGRTIEYALLSAGDSAGTTAFDGGHEQSSYHADRQQPEAIDNAAESSSSDSAGMTSHCESGLNLGAIDITA